ncbi:MAG: hypothetical protein RRB51_03000 [Thermoproteus sp.]|nr:hypothetical protein [Thermoproteus sp.]
MERAPLTCGLSIKDPRSRRAGGSVLAPGRRGVAMPYGLRR